MDILFAVMPFSDVERPAIGVSLLHARLRQMGIRSKVSYLNVGLAERIGLELYGWLSQRGDQLLLVPSAPASSLAGEWFFSGTAFPGQLPPDEEYAARFLEPAPEARKLIPEILAARRHADDYIAECVAEVQRHSPRVVGFTTTFEQTCACLAVARRLKQGVNPPIVMFGGANCEGEMGRQLLRSFPWVDYVCVGEGDEALPVFLEGLIRDGNTTPPPGIVSRDSSDALSAPSPIRDMDALPVPDYSSYFERVNASPLRETMRPRLLIETSRGCWWGEKHHCTFCGLNGATMAYRSKSAARVLREIGELTASYGVNRFDCVDNILDTRYLQTVFPELIRKGPEVDMFYETKANLRFDQLRILRDAGVRMIQPGIESFSNEILRLMDKGCTGAQNLQLLRWCEELGIFATWNLLFGFPDELPSEYERMAALTPLLTHLQPPAYCVRIRMDRFSPLYNHAGHSGVARRRPMPAYSYVYPLAAEELERLAYFFEFEYADGRDPAAYASDVVREAWAWMDAKGEDRARLDLFRARSLLMIQDTRPCAVRPTHLLRGLAADLYLLCDAAHHITAITKKLRGTEESQIRETLAPLIADKLMVELEGQYLSLAVFRNRAEEGPEPPAVEEHLVQIG